ncbi:MAG TPA: J domain-containing protein [Acidimicrobiia bacterium]|nr:J domain-containing protein [Acidimicrobiia bacterium]
MASVTVRRGDLYKVLGVSADATPDEITAAFRAHAKALHPDRNPGDDAAADRFKDLTLAYQTLIRPRSRDAYDRRHRAGPAVSPPSARVDPVSPHRRDPLFQTEGRARAAVGAGVALFLLGVAAAVALLVVDTGSVGETVTLWIAAAKLLLAGPVLVGVGLVRLQRIATGQ